MANEPLGPGRGSAWEQASDVFAHHQVKTVVRGEGEKVRPEIENPAVWEGLDRGTAGRLLGQVV
ncbi:hypothetical protein GBA63_19735 [Rubrobacter tropicus]|uniref:Uncharacterized protein n=1 Tax=Rubrobacter tropicus TaxID=2653851 RepID=A0A6G8QDW1_9ACTN|nr:hypothetical protein [Rubrobacter tropicus]QIN84632.1 hypothetical protein GBA63_19735 [Rubrobacter tropicus]